MIKIEKSYKRRAEERKIEKRNFFFAALLFFCLFPFLLSNWGSVEKQNPKQAAQIGTVWVITHHAWGTKKVPLEEYLVGMLAATIPAEYELETLKAQAVLLRSTSLSLAERKEGIKQISDEQLKDSYFTKKHCQKLWGKEYENNFQKLSQAVKETKGLVLIWEGEITAPPFFQLSNGNTRNIKEYRHYEDYFPYLSSISCPMDCEAPNYIHYLQIEEKTFHKRIAELLGEKKWKPEKIILCKDTTDYVKMLQIGDRQIRVEEFQKAMGLPSSAFSMEKAEPYIEFQIKGLGHGFGFSQNTANEMAKEGKTYKELLNFFFPNLSIERI